jgi:type IV pilus assembly protein PilE
MQKDSAFSFLEVLLVLLISGILIVLAVPNYQKYIRKSRRIDGIHSISALRLAEEKYRTTNNQYGNLAQVQSLTNTPLSTHYTYTITNVSATSYTITATAQGAQTSDTESGTACNILIFVTNNTVVTKTPVICWN